MNLNTDKLLKAIEAQKLPINGDADIVDRAVNHGLEIARKMVEHFIELQKLKEVEK